MGSKINGAAYDRWKTTPPEPQDPDEPVECHECDGTGIGDITDTGDPDSPCPCCDGDGFTYPAPEQSPESYDADRDGSCWDPEAGYGGRS